MREIINTRVLETSKGPRIWFEGLRLDSGGFSKGTFYDKVATNNSIVLKINPEGKMKVSGKRRNGQSVSLIDMCGKWISEIFKTGDLITISISRGSITIARHKEGTAQRERVSRVLSGETIKEGALCYGIGVSAHAISKGLQDSNVDSEVTLVMERENKYLEVAAKNNETLSDETMVVQGNLEDCEFDKLDNLDVLSLSLPCTGHSPAGKSKNKLSNAEEHSTDALAIFGAVRTIYATNPAFIISENVVQAQNSASYILFKAELRRLGYEIFETIMGQEEGACIEKRVRYWFVAVTKELAHLFSIQDIQEYIPERKYKTVGCIVEEKDDHNFFSSDAFLKRERDNAKKGRGFKCNFINLEDSSFGVIPKSYSKRQVSNPHLQHSENSDVRLFTPVESARAKGIPEELIEGISATTAHEGLGQSVLYHHAYILSRIVGDLISKARSIFREDKDKTRD